MADAPLTGWQPLETAPDGQRVLLGPRYAPVVGIVRQKPFWAEDQDPAASVIHYNGTVLVAGYHCSEWHPLPAAESLQPPAAPLTPLTDEQCVNLYSEWDFGLMDDEAYAVIRAVESAHGITTHKDAP